MGEWDDRPFSPEFAALMRAVQKADREDYAAWRRGEGSPAQKVFEGAAPKHAYAGNRKRRRAQAKGRKV